MAYRLVYTDVPAEEILEPSENDIIRHAKRWERRCPLVTPLGMENGRMVYSRCYNAKMRGGEFCWMHSDESSAMRTERRLRRRAENLLRRAEVVLRRAERDLARAKQREQSARLESERLSKEAAAIVSRLDK